MRPDQARRVESNLTVQQEVFQRSLATLLHGLKHVDVKFLETMKSSLSEAEVQRKKEKENLKKSLMAIVIVIQKLKCNIKNEHFLKEHDAEYFKNHLTSIEENLSSFRNLLSEQWEVLKQQEASLQQSIDSLNQRRTETSEASTSKQDKTHCRSSMQRTMGHTSPQEKMHQDVQEFHQFLRSNGGHTGGWETSDHLLFTRFLQKYRSLDQMTTVLLDYMPDKTPEEIAKHETWYHEYLTLKDAQRKALREWREEQRKQKQNNEMREKEDPATDSLALVVNKQPSERDPRIKEQIRQWKEKQEQKRQQQLHELHEKKKLEQEAWRKKVAYFEQQRQILSRKRKEEHKTTQNGEVKAKDCEIILPKKHIPLSNFWEQDKQYVQRRRSRIEQLCASPSNSSKRSSSHSTVHAERDPARLLQSTAVWRARIKRSLSEEGNRHNQGNHKILYIADVPHLAVPKWREGLMKL